MSAGKKKILFVETDDIFDCFRSKRTILEDTYFFLKDTCFRLWFRDELQGVSRFDWLFAQPIGLSFLSAALKSNFHDKIDIGFYSFTLKRLFPNYATWGDFLSEYKPDVIAFSNNNFISEDNCVEKIILAKKILPGVKTVLGGINVTFRKDYFLERSPIDYIVLGEGERIIVRVICDILGIFSAIEEKNIKCFEVAHNRFVYYEEGKSPILDREVDYSGLFHNRYLRLAPFAIIQSKRGCGYMCRFCLGRHYWGGEVRVRDIDNVVRELRFLIKKGARFIYFTDADFFALPEYAVKLLTMLIHEKLNTVHFGIQTRIRDFDGLMLKLLQESNVRYIFTGIENIDPEVVSRLQKGTTLSYRKIMDIIYAFSKHGIFSEIALMIDRSYLIDKIFRKNITGMKELYNAGAGWIDVRNYIPFPGLEGVKKTDISPLQKRNYYFYGYPVCGFTLTENREIRKKYLLFMKECIRTVLKKNIFSLYFYPTFIKSYVDNFRKFHWRQ